MLIKRSAVLQEIWLQLNDIGQQGAGELSRALNESGSLLTLSLLGCSSITSTGAVMLVASLRKNSSLRRLQLPEAFESDCKAVPGYESVKGRVEWYADITQQSAVEIVGKTVDCDVLGTSSVSVLTRASIVFTLCMSLPIHRI